MSRNPFNSYLSWQSVNLTHCWRINREQRAVWIKCWQLTSAAVKPWNPHQFQDVQQTREEGCGWLCSGEVEQSYLLQSDILSHTHTEKTYTPADEPSFDTSIWTLHSLRFTPYSQKKRINSQFRSVLSCQVLKSISTTTSWNVKRPLGFRVFLMNYKLSSSS